MVLSILTTNIYIIGQIIEERRINDTPNKGFIKNRAIYTGYNAFEPQ